MRKILTWLGIAFVIFYLVSDPAGAAHFARNALHGAHTAAASMTTFVSSL